MPDFNDMKNIKPDALSLKRSKLIEKVLKPFSPAMRDKAIGALLARDVVKAVPLPVEKQLSVEALRPTLRRFHGTKVALQ